MNFLQLISSVIVATAPTTPRAAAQPGPYEGGQFKGRIAYSADGNHNDPDDWAASPVALAILAEAGAKGRLVHFDYNCILPKTDPDWEKIHADGVLGAAERYGFDKSVFHDCRKNLDGAVADIARVIDASSADDPLYFIVAGPMEVPVLGIRKSDPAKRKHVYCISHSTWNDGFSSKYTFTHTKRSVIESGVRWIQIKDQNPLLSRSPYGRPATPDEFRDFFWMRDSRDSKVRFLWERTLVSKRPDPSDAGMAYFLVTGDEQADAEKLRSLLDEKVVPRPVRARSQVRLEAENFVHLDGYAVEHTNKAASHRLAVKPIGGDSGRISTAFDEPYTAPRGRYDIDVRYFDDDGGRCRFALLVNGQTRDTWESAGRGGGWATQTVRGVEVAIGDEIAIEVKNTPAKLDFVQLNGIPAAP